MNKKIYTAPIATVARITMESSIGTGVLFSGAQAKTSLKTWNGTDVEIGADTETDGGHAISWY